MNFNNKDSLYEEAKRSLKKLVGDITGMSISQESDVKFQAEISEKIEDVLFTTGCEKFSGERTQNLARTFGHNQGFVNHSGVAKIRTRKNPMGANGRPLTGKTCSSYRHFVAHCPDSWENIARENREEINRKSNIFFLTMNLKCYLIVIVKRIAPVVDHEVMQYLTVHVAVLFAGENG